MVFTCFMLGGLICLFAPPKLTGKLQLAYARVFSWPLATGRGLTQAFRATPRADAVRGTDYTKLIAVNRRLKNHVANMQAQLKDAQKQINQLTHLRRTVPQWDRMRLLLADIITVTGQTQNELFLNRGQEDGLAVGQFIVGDNSIIGTVSDISARRAKVKLITDPTSRIPVKIGDLDIKRVMEGRAGNIAKIRLVPAKHKIGEGDLVYAEKDPGLLDIPIIAAEVTKCRRDPDNPELWDITVRPVCDIANLRNVAVIVAAPRPE